MGVIPTRCLGTGGDTRGDIGAHRDVVPRLGAGDGAKPPRVRGGRGADGRAAGDVAASHPAVPGEAGVMSWLGLSAGRELAARPGPVPVEPGREGLGCHLLPGSKQLLFGRAGARRQFWCPAGRWQGSARGVLWVPREGEARVQRCRAAAGHGSKKSFAAMCRACSCLEGAPCPIPASAAALKFGKMGTFGARRRQQGRVIPARRGQGLRQLGTFVS